VDSGVGFGSAPIKAQDTSPILFWDFSNVKNRTANEQISGMADILEGNFNTAQGIITNGLRLNVES
jgi:hypothetical protein